MGGVDQQHTYYFRSKDQFESLLSRVLIGEHVFTSCIYK